jgi:hypothetical protein
MSPKTGIFPIQPISFILVSVLRDHAFLGQAAGVIEDRGRRERRCAWIDLPVLAGPSRRESRSQPLLRKSAARWRDSSAPCLAERQGPYTLQVSPPYDSPPTGHTALLEG